MKKIIGFWLVSLMFIGSTLFCALQHQELVEEKSETGHLTQEKQLRNELILLFQNHSEKGGVSLRSNDCPLLFTMINRIINEIATTLHMDPAADLCISFREEDYCNATANIETKTISIGIGTILKFLLGSTNEDCQSFYFVLAHEMGHLYNHEYETLNEHNLQLNVVMASLLVLCIVVIDPMISMLIHPKYQSSLKKSAFCAASIIIATIIYLFYSNQKISALSQKEEFFADQKAFEFLRTKWPALTNKSIKTILYQHFTKGDEAIARKNSLNNVPAQQQNSTYNEIVTIITKPFKIKTHPSHQARIDNVDNS